MELRLVKTQYEKNLVKSIITNYHSYVPSNQSVGRRIDFLIYDDNGFDILGMIGGGSSVYPPPKDILRHIGVSKEEYKAIFNSIANNWRFCMIVKRKNLGTRILKMFRNQLKVEWKNKYDNDLKYIITFVGDGHDGAMYKADNWKLIGKTSGLPAHKSTSMKWSSKEQLDANFVKPIGGSAQKLIFIKDV